VTTILGIRHHGPGSARSVLAELERLQPDALLVEGPSDANSLIDLIEDPAMRPPVRAPRLLAGGAARRDVLPLGRVQPGMGRPAMALEHGIRRGSSISPPASSSPSPRPSSSDGWRRPAQRPRSPPEAEATAAAESTAGAEEAPEPPPAEVVVRTNPLSELARAAGDDDADGERFWDRLVESRRDPGELFAAVSEAMTAVRGALPENDD
jgi:hypothetical protein